MSSTASAAAPSAVLSAPSSQGPVIKEGYMVKEGGTIKSWKKRWFILRGNTISYYKVKGDSVPAGTIYVEELVAVEPTAEKKKPHCLALRGKAEDARVYYMTAESEDDMHDWIKAINQVRRRDARPSPAGAAAAATSTVSTAGGGAGGASTSTPGAFAASSTATASAAASATATAAAGAPGSPAGDSSTTAGSNAASHLSPSSPAPRTLFSPASGGPQALSSSATQKIYVTAECFATFGVCIVGTVHPRLLRALSHGCAKEDKLRYERGWFVNRLLPINTILNLFSLNGWSVETMYESEGFHPNNSDPKPVTCILFSKPKRPASAAGVPALSAAAVQPPVAAKAPPSAKTHYAPPQNPDAIYAVPLKKELREPAARANPVRDPNYTGDRDGRQLVQWADKFRVENGMENKDVPLPVDASSQIMIENPELEVCWYSNFFRGKEHSNFVGFEEEEGPFVLSVMHEVDRFGSNRLQQSLADLYQYRTIVWRKTGVERILVPVKNTKETLSPLDLLALACPTLAERSGIKLREVDEVTEDFTKQLISMEDTIIAKKYKFGALYAKEGQVKENDMFGNKHGSQLFDDFLLALGDRVELSGWPKFRAGLDIKKNMTGTHSVYTSFRGYEIMFHVSTMLPYNEGDRQQLERKRHIGNDIATILFMDGTETPFSPKAISSHFLHVFAVVQPEPADAASMDDVQDPISEGNATQYRVHVVSSDKVPPFGPSLPNPPVFRSASALREFLLTKLINGETSTYTSETFQARNLRTLTTILKYVFDKYFETSSKSSVTKKLNITPQSVSASSGDAGVPGAATAAAPSVTSGTLLIPGAVFNLFDIYTVSSLLVDFPHEIYCAVKISDDTVLLGTDYGLFSWQWNFGSEVKELRTEKRRCYLKLTVRKDLGVLIAMGAKKGGHAYILVYALNDIIASSSKKQGVSVTVKGKKLNSTRGCTVFDTIVDVDPGAAGGSGVGGDGPISSSPGTGTSGKARKGSTTKGKDEHHPILCAGVRKSLVFFNWSVGTREFVKTRELLLPENASQLKFTWNSVALSIGNELNVLDMHSGGVSTVALPQVGQKTSISSLALLDGSIQVTFNNLTAFMDWKGAQAKDLVLKWSSVPHSVVATTASHILGFTANMIELRSMLNGASLQAVPFQSTALLMHDKTTGSILVSHTREDEEGSKSHSVYKIQYPVKNGQN